MIFNNIGLLEKNISKELAQNLISLKTLQKIKTLLNKVDHKVEEIPVTTEDKLVELLRSLKDKPLTKMEIEIASWIINIKTEKS